MDRKEISARFHALVAPSLPNEWEFEEIVDRLAAVSDDFCDHMLHHVPAVWPISQSLCFRYLRKARELDRVLPPEYMEEWVRQLLFNYERGGLRDAEDFMGDVEANFLFRYNSESRVALTDLSATMTHYIRGVSGRMLGITEGAQVWTDTETIYVPPELNIFPDLEDNKRFYKFILTYQAVLTQQRVFERIVDGNTPASVSDMLDRLHGAHGADLPLRIFLFIEAAGYIRQALPGLWERTSMLLKSQFEPQAATAVNRCVNRWWDRIETDPNAGASVSTAISLDGFTRFQAACEGLENVSLSRPQKLLFGSFNLEKAGTVITLRREDERRRFVNMLARILPQQTIAGDPAEAPDSDESPGAAAAADSVGVISEALEQVVKDRERRVLQIDNAQVVVPDELVELSRRIMDDLGALPVGYVQAASGLACGGRPKNGVAGASDDTANAGAQNEYVYDEWDCRRNGYRRDWCTVIDEELAVVRSDFIARTLQKHNGLRKRLRMQFEMMRNTHRTVRRQRDGDDIDLDAVIDAMGDARAGVTVADRLFVRLQRDKRDIATIFLIDMSNSTTGWIGTFIKEALVLLCEAMEKIGDRYGIYGFSGMKRSRCKLYHIKTLDEVYDESVKERISAIGPKDYTRMAPAIRHLTSILEQVDSKTRLLITLSDGKPEDYDGYNGEYAIEDTRKALREAQGRGVKPFCVTIDKQSHAYLDHMFGVGNYIFINKIEHLPEKMAQIYRVLTR